MTNDNFVITEYLLYAITLLLLLAVAISLFGWF